MLLILYTSIAIYHKPLPKAFSHWLTKCLCHKKFTVTFFLCERQYKLRISTITNLILPTWNRLSNNKHKVLAPNYRALIAINTQILWISIDCNGLGCKIRGSGVQVWVLYANMFPFCKLYKKYMYIQGRLFLDLIQSFWIVFKGNNLYHAFREFTSGKIFHLRLKLPHNIHFVFVLLQTKFWILLLLVAFKAAWAYDDGPPLQFFVRQSKFVFSPFSLIKATFRTSPSEPYLKAS